MLNEGVRMHPSYVVLAYCDELMKEFWTLCIFVMTVSETVMVETIPYSNIGLTHCL